MIEWVYRMKESKRFKVVLLNLFNLGNWLKSIIMGEFESKISELMGWGR